MFLSCERLVEIIELGNPQTFEGSSQYQKNVTAVLPPEFCLLPTLVFCSGAAMGDDQLGAGQIEKKGPLSVTRF